MAKTYTIDNLLRMLDNSFESDYIRYEVLLKLDRIEPFKCIGDPKFFKLEDYLERVLSNAYIDKYPIDKEITSQMLEQCKRDRKYSLTLSRYLKNFLYENATGAALLHFPKMETVKNILCEEIKRGFSTELTLIRKIIKFFEEDKSNQRPSVQVFSNGFLGYLLPFINLSFDKLEIYNTTNRIEEEIKGKILANILSMQNCECSYSKECNSKNAIIFSLGGSNSIKDNVAPSIYSFLSSRYYQNIDFYKFEKIAIVVPTSWITNSKFSPDILKQYIEGRNISKVYQFQSYGVSLVEIHPGKEKELIQIYTYSSGRPSGDITLTYKDIEQNNYSLCYEDYAVNYHTLIKKIEDYANKINKIDRPIVNYYIPTPRPNNNVKEVLTIQQFLEKSNESEGLDFSFKIYRGYQADEKSEISSESFKYSNTPKDIPTFYFLKPEAVDQSIEYLDVSKLRKMNPKAASLISGSNESDSTLLKLALKPWDIIISNRLSPTKPMVIGQGLFSRMNKTVSAMNNEYIIPSGSYMVIRCGNEYAAYYLKKYLESEQFQELIQNKYGDKLNSTFVSVKDFPLFSIEYNANFYKKSANEYHQLIQELHELGKRMIEVKKKISEL